MIKIKLKQCTDMNFRNNEDFFCSVSNNGRKTSEYTAPVLRKSSKSQFKSASVQLYQHQP